MNSADGSIFNDGARATGNGKLMKYQKDYKKARNNFCVSNSIKVLICNDSKREIIIFCFWDSDPNYEENE